MSRFRAYDGNHAPKPPFELNRDSPQAQGLTAWYPGGSGNVQTARDFSGKNLHLTAENSPLAAVNALGGYSMDFSNANANWNIADNIFVRAQRPMSAFCWCNHADGSATERLFWRRGDGGGWTLGLENSERLGFTFFDVTGTTSNILSGAITPVLFLVGVTVSVSGAVNYYHNGVNVGTSSVGIPITTTQPLRMGVFTDSSGSVAGDSDHKQFDSKLYNIEVSPAVAYDMWQPPTRWGLRWQPGRVTYFVPAVVGGVPIPVAMNSYRQRQKAAA